MTADRGILNQETSSTTYKRPYEGREVILWF